MLKFVLPVLMVAATSAQTFFYPTTSSSSMYRYGGYSSYYPTYTQMPASYIRSGYFYPYTRTHMTMTYPTFMARSDAATHEAIKPDFKPEYKPHHIVRPVEAPIAMTTGHHVPVHVPHVTSGTPVTGTPVHHRHHDSVTVAVPATFAYGYPAVPVSAPVSKDMIPTVASDAVPVASHHHRHVSQPTMAIAVPVSSGAGYPVPFAFEYPSQVSSGRVEPSAIGMTGGASFVAASAVPVDVKSGFDVPAPVASTHHDAKHTNFEGKKSSF